MNKKIELNMRLKIKMLFKQSNNTNMDTNAKLQTFLAESLDAETFNKLCSSRKQILVGRLNFIMSISTTKLSSEILALIEKFLADLPFEEASTYISAPSGWMNDCVILMCENIDFMKIIIGYVWNINARNRYKNNALMRECLLNPIPNIEKIKFLLEHKIDVNAVNIRSQTALMYCCMNEVQNIEEILELLIFSGADVFMKSRKGKTAYDYVKHKTLLSERMSQLLQGTIRLNKTKKAI